MPCHLDSVTQGGLGRKCYDEVENEAKGQVQHGGSQVVASNEKSSLMSKSQGTTGRTPANTGEQKVTTLTRKQKHKAKENFSTALQNEINPENKHSRIRGEKFPQ